MSNQPSKIKVLHLITHLGFGGASDNTLITVERLSRDKYEVHLAAGQDYMDWVDRGRAGVDKLFLFPELYRAPRPLVELRMLRQLIQFMRKEQYDIVHTHNAKAGILGRIAAHRAGVPIILHTFHLLSWQDAYEHGATGLKKLLASAKEQFYFQVERYTASISHKIVTVCQSNMNEAIALKLAPAEKFRTIYSGIDLEKFDIQVDREAKCAQLGLEPQHPIVGMIGRLSPQKAPLDFVQTAKLVLAQKPEVQFIMVGDGTQAEEVAKAIGHEDRIQVLGYRDDIPEIYGILDIFALASLWEGLGRCLTEAMIYGVPVAATAVNGIPELVTHKETGMLSEPENPAQLAENVLWLLEHPEETQQLVQAGKARVLPTFDVNYMVEEIDALYEELRTEGLAHSC